MRRWLVLLLCICMIFSLSSCGSRGDGPETGSREKAKAAKDIIRTIHEFLYF